MPARFSSPTHGAEGGRREGQRASEQASEGGGEGAREGRSRPGFPPPPPRPRLAAIQRCGWSRRRGGSLSRPGLAEPRVGVQCAGCPGDGFSALARCSRYCLTRGCLIASSCLLSAESTPILGWSLPLSLLAPCSGDPGPAGGGRGKRPGSRRSAARRPPHIALVQGTPGAAQRAAHVAELTTRRVLQHSPQPAQVGHARIPEHQPGGLQSAREPRQQRSRGSLSNMATARGNNGSAEAAPRRAER
jgi:hypothetical protein